MMRAPHLRRLSPLLPLTLLAVALVGLAVILVDDSPPASADHQEPDAIWTATLTTIADTPGGVGCNNDFSAPYPCSSTARLTDDDFTYDGVTYSIIAVSSTSANDVATLIVSFDTAPAAAWRANAKLHANGRIFSLADAGLTGSNKTFTWRRPASEGLPSFATGGVSRVVSFQLTVPGTTPPSGVTLAGDDLDTSGGTGHFELSVTEGGSSTFTVALSADPGSDATVLLTPTQYFQSDAGEPGHEWDMNAVTISPSSLTFTAGGSGNYGTPQTVTVTAPEDDDRAPEQLVILILAPAQRYAYVYVGQGNGNYKLSTSTVKGSYVWAGNNAGDHSRQLVDTQDPVGGSSNSVTGVYVKVSDNDASNTIIINSPGGGEWCPDPYIDDITGELVVPECSNRQPLQTGGGESDVGVIDPYADLIAQMKEWRNDPQWKSFKAHTDRWDRALLAFGETVDDTTLTKMTAAEAQGYADQGWTRWDDVAEAMREIEAAAQSQQDQNQQQTPNNAPTVSSAISDATIVNESGTHKVSLSGVFDDTDGDSLTITASSDDTTVATVSVASDGSSLTVTAKSRGTATITVSADDGNGGTVDDAFTVKVKSAPTVASAIGDVSGMTPRSTQDVSLSGVFSDADGDALTITAESSNENAVYLVLEVDDQLALYAFLEGSATVTVTAEDADGNTVSDSFDVTVVAAAQPDPTPTPTPTPQPTATPTTETETDTSDVVARYDADGDGKISNSELSAALNDYYRARITYSQMLEIYRAR